ncbi:ion channel [Alkalimarinus alittae]|uniref:Ion channel n=1 Tax=Alkalimarinus alittae TaxID=2961619 RepID=A0ABY6N6K6_9ALTE|nr:ion channel [Alkalimarinus alittae]UZE97660.1 ion channel [Alkalimarinus alittae]
MLNPFISVIFLTSLYLVNDNRHFLMVGLLILLPVITINILYYFDKRYLNSLIGTISYIAFFSYISIFLGRFLAQSKNVSINVIYAAVCLYFFIAIIWSFIYIATYNTLENAFSFSDALPSNLNPHDDSISVFSYFSFVTMTTLGYGDITPIHPIARAWVSAQTVLGQLYLAIVMARFVGLYISESKKEN